MRNVFTLMAASLLTLSTGAQTLRGSADVIPDNFNPYDLAHPAPTSVLYKIAQTSDDSKAGDKASKRKTAQQNQEKTETVKYFTAAQSCFSNWAYVPDGGDIKTYDMEVAVDGDKVTLSNFFNLYDPSSWAPIQEKSITGTYNATDKTITIPAPTTFENATVIGTIMNYYTGTLAAGTIDDNGTFTPAENLILHVDGDFERIYLDGMAAGVYMWTPSGTKNYGISSNAQCWKYLTAQKYGNGGSVLTFSNEMNFGQTYSVMPVTKTLTLVNSSETATDFAMDLVSDPEGAFTADSTSGTIEAHSTKAIKLTFSSKVAGEAEGLASVETEINDDPIEVQLNGKILTPPDFSSVVKNGEIEFGTDIANPFKLETLNDGKVVVRSAELTKKNSSSKLDLSFEVPEGKLGKLSYKGGSDITGGSYMTGYFTDDLSNPAGTYSSAHDDIAKTLEFAPGKHTVRFQLDCYADADAQVAKDTKIYLYDIALDLQDLKADEAVLSDSTANMGYAVLSGEGSGEATKSGSISIINKGSNNLSVIKVTSDNPEFSASEKIEPVGTMKTLVIPVSFKSTVAGEKEANLTVETSAGTFKAKAIAKVLAKPDFSKVITEGYDFITVDNDPNCPFVVDGDSAYNVNCNDPDNAATTSMMTFNFTIPDGKIGIMSWDGYVWGEENYSGDYGKIDISHPKGGATKYLLSPATGDAGSNSRFTSESGWAKHLMCTPGDYSISFEYVRNGDGKTTGKSMFYIKNFKLAVNDFVEHSAKLENDKVDFEPCYVGAGRKSEASVKINNLGSQDLTINSISENGPFSGVASTAVASYGSSAVVDLYFQPTEKGTFTGDVTISTNAGDFTVHCSGKTLDDTGIIYNGDFEDGCAGWTYGDEDGDGAGWTQAYWLFGGGLSETEYSKYCHSGSNLLGSASKSSGGVDLTPDNWAVSPAITIPADGAVLSYWVASLDYRNSEEFYTVYVSESDDYNTISSNGTVLFDGLFEQPEGVNGIAWTNKQYSLDDFAGKTVHIAFRHHNCSGQYLLMLDDAFIYNHGYVPSGINSVSSSKAEDIVESYTIDGIRTNSLQKGINIVKMANGTTRKIMIK